MSNSFSPASMNFQSRPQVCHPSPPDPEPEPDVPTQIVADYKWERMQIVPPNTSTELEENRALPKVDETPSYQISDVDDAGQAYTLTVELAVGDGTTYLTIVLTLSTGETVIMTAEYGPWDGSETWNLGSVELTYSSGEGEGFCILKSHES